jgi:hypothetical protein
MAQQLTSTGMFALRAGPPQLVTFCAAHKKRQFAAAHAVGVINLGGSVDSIEELEKHQKSRGHNFGSLENFEIWCDEVQPLLHFSGKHERSFEQAKTAALVTYRIGSKGDADNNISETIGIVNQAIVFAKTMKTAIEAESGKQPESIVYPEKVTISWLAKHVEVKYWVAVFMFIVAIFGVGIKVGSSTIYLDYIQPSLSSEKPKSNNL